MHFRTRIVMLALAVAVLGAGCSRHKEEHGARVVNSRPVIVDPNVEVAKVRKGMTRDEVKSVLGEPKREDQTTAFYKGMWVRFDTNGVVFNVKCVKQFPGVTKEGIGINSSIDDLVAAYGKPNELKHFDDGEDWWYASSAISYCVQRGKVTSFIVHF